MYSIYYLEDPIYPDGPTIGNQFYRNLTEDEATSRLHENLHKGKLGVIEHNKSINSYKPLEKLDIPYHDKGLVGRGIDIDKQTASTFMKKISQEGQTHLFKGG